MKTLARLLVITALAAALSGCLSGGEPDIGHRAQALNTVDVEKLDLESVSIELIPSDLMSCDAFYGADWDTFDTIVNVTERPGQVVLVQAGEMVCTGQMTHLGDRLRDVDLGALVPLDNDSIDENGGGVDLGDGQADNPKGDSNPLPANPSEDESDDSPVADSNPLPANPGEESGDSNPLPARADAAKASSEHTSTVSASTR